ncbi:MAG TPA: HPF/RaiA family ribosome-associated protein [Lacunisphaera sp.]|nr:HPF/RaiA family ribosome-associated protein [Lacunisphaera sp.]
MDASKFIIRGVHLDLTESLYRAAFEKAARLFRLNPRIARVMIDLEIDQSRGPADRFIARGRIHLDGSEMIASAHSENTYKALDLLIETLDALLRTRDTLRAKEEQPAGDLKVAS